MIRRLSILGISALTLLWWSVSLAENSQLSKIDAHLKRDGAQKVLKQLTPQELSNLDRTLNTKGRTIPSKIIAKLIANPVAWKPGPEGREFLRSVLKALPKVASIPGAEHALQSACNPDSSNFRGFGFEVIASAALIGYREPNGVNPKIVRMSANIRGDDGKMRESDGCAMFGADKVQRLVTMKSISSVKALKGAMKKAASQLSLRNGSQSKIKGKTVQPGVIMLGYSDPMVLEAARRKDWGAAATRSRAKLLVLAVNQLSGKVTRLASVMPSSRTNEKRIEAPIAPKPGTEKVTPTIHRRSSIHTHGTARVRRATSTLTGSATRSFKRKPTTTARKRRAAVRTFKFKARARKRATLRRFK